MTQAIYSWMRSIAFYYLFYSIIMNILPDNRYRAYIKDFLGMLLIILLLSPVLNLFQLDGILDAQVALNQMQEAYAKGVDRPIEFEEENHDYQQYAYEQEIANQITEFLEARELYVWDIVVTVKSENDKFYVNQIKIVAGRTKKGENMVGKVTITPDEESQEVLILKKELQEVYQMNPVNIIINIQE